MSKQKNVKTKKILVYRCRKKKNRKLINLGASKRVVDYKGVIDVDFVFFLFFLWFLFCSVFYFCFNRRSINHPLYVHSFF